MKQKYDIIKDNEKNELILKESAELDKDILSVLCEQIYDSSSVEEAIKESREALISLLRTKNMYPPYIYMERIADAVIEIYVNGGQSSTEIYFNDAEFLSYNEPEAVDDIAAIDDEADELDDLLDDSDSLDDAIDDDDISNIGANSSIKIADDESLDIDDDV